MSSVVIFIRSIRFEKPEKLLNFYTSPEFWFLKFLSEDYNQDVYRFKQRERPIPMMSDPLNLRNPKQPFKTDI